MTVYPQPTKDVARLVQMIGPEAALALMERHGGTRLYVAREPAAGSAIVEAIGLDAARALGQCWGGDMLMVPIGRSWRIQVYRSQGLSYREIARRAGASESGVYRALARAEMTARQLDLFQ